MNKIKASGTDREGRTRWELQRAKDKQSIIALLSVVVLVLLLALACLLLGAGAKSAEVVTASAVQTEQADKLTVTEVKPLGTFKAYAYCSCEKCCGKALGHDYYGITATGTVATQGRTIAVDPDVIPLGSTVYVNGVEYIAEDTGSGIKGKVIDIYCDTHEAALAWGVQPVEVEIALSETVEIDS